MAARQEEDNDLNFSDNDSDEDGSRNSRPVIAHKIMRAPESSEKIDAENKRYDTVSPPAEEEEINKEENFEPISPASDTKTSNEENFDPISPPDSPEKSANNFENISDDEADPAPGPNKVPGFIEDGKVSPIQKSDNELDFNDENSNDSSSKVTTKPVTDSQEAKKIEQNAEESEQKKDTDTNKKADEDDIDAPVPSPFSDIGDVEDMGTGTDNEMISDIMKDSQENDFTIESKENKSEKQDNIDDTVKDNKDDATVSENIEEDEESLLEGEKHQEQEASSSQASASEPSAGSLTIDAPGPSHKGEDVETEETDANENDMIAIFGDSDDEDGEEFQGFNEDEIGDDGETASKDQEEEEERPASRDSDSDDDRVPDKQDYVSDFDLMMAKKKAQRAKRKSKKDGFETLGDQDDLISEMIKEMFDCAKEDRMLNQCGKAATKKLKMLATVSTHLRKADLQSIFIDSGVLPAMKEWLTPLPDHALPHVNIRKIFLKILLDLPPVDRTALKKSGIGRAVMLLFKHPKETSDNRKVAGRIISNWARPIFNVSTNFQDMSREERENRDKATLPEAKKRRLSSGAESGRNRLDEDDENRPRKPGDKGWIGRARVPMPSHKDYVNRPESKIDYDISKSAKRELNRYEKQARKMGKKGDGGAGTHGNRKAVGISLNGSKLTL